MTSEIPIIYIHQPTKQKKNGVCKYILESDYRRPNAELLFFPLRGGAGEPEYLTFHCHWVPCERLCFQNGKFYTDPVQCLVPFSSIKITTILACFSDVRQVC